MTQQKQSYFQHVKASGQMFGFLGLMLGVTGGVLTGVAVKGLVDEPLVTGGGAIAFYAAFSLSSLMTLFVMLNYLSMSLRITTDQLDIRGTPAFLIGDRLIPGAVDLETMKRLIAEARAGS